MKGLRGMNEPVLTCGEILTLKLNPANNTLTVSSLEVHAYTSVAAPFFLSFFFTRDARGNTIRTLLALHITMHAGLHANKHILSCLLS